MSKEVIQQNAQPINDVPKVAATAIQTSSLPPSLTTSSLIAIQTNSNIITTTFNNIMASSTSATLPTATFTGTTNEAQNNNTVNDDLINNNNTNSTNYNNETLPTAVGYGVFGLLAIIAIIYIVKYSIEIDKENYKKQLMINNTNFQPTRKPTLNTTPQMNNVRLSPSIDNNTSFSSMNYNGQMNFNGSMNSNQLGQPQRNSVLHSPSSPNSINQYNSFVPTNNFQSGVSYTNRQSRQYLLQNNY